MAGGIRNQVGEALHRYRVTVVDGGFDGFGERRIRAMWDGFPVAPRIYGHGSTGSNAPAYGGLKV